MNRVLKTNGNGNVCRASTKKRNVSIGFLGKIDVSKDFLSIRNIFMDPCNNINLLFIVYIYLFIFIYCLLLICLLAPLIKMNVYLDPLCNKSIYICPSCIGIHVKSILITQTCVQANVLLKTGFVHVRHIGSRYICHQATIGLGLVCPVI